MAAEVARAREAGTRGELHRGYAPFFFQELLGPFDTAVDGVPVRCGGSPVVVLNRQAKW